MVDLARKIKGDVLFGFYGCIKLWLRHGKLRAYKD